MNEILIASKKSIAWLTLKDSTSFSRFVLSFFFPLQALETMEEGMVSVHSTWTSL